MSGEVKQKGVGIKSGLSCTPRFVNCVLVINVAVLNRVGWTGLSCVEGFISLNKMFLPACLAGACSFSYCITLPKPFVFRRRTVYTTGCIKIEIDNRDRGALNNSGLKLVLDSVTLRTLSLAFSRDTSAL